MMMIVLLTVEADSQTEVGQSRHEARLLHFLNSLLHYLTRLFAGRIPSLFQPLQRILDDNYANLRSLRSEVEAQGGRAAEVSEVLVAVAQAGWEGEGEGGQMIVIAGGIIVDDTVAREQILKLFKEHSGSLFYDEIAEKLNLPLRQTVEICNQLEQEGLIGEPTTKGDRDEGIDGCAVGKARCETEPAQ